MGMSLLQTAGAGQLSTPLLPLLPPASGSIRFEPLLLCFEQQPFPKRQPAEISMHTDNIILPNKPYLAT